MREFEIGLLGSDGLTHFSQIQCLVSHEEVRFDARSERHDPFSTKQADAFECLGRYREYLEKLGLKPLCVGARIDAFPSGMCRDMGRGFAAYITEMGTAAATRPESIFDPADAATIATVGEQKQRHEDWLESFG
ncbi:hypothetical protein [Erythrobacter sp.]|uniref:hypothetical protein n=1 Tax=Erythrobacter sp. TaxID=1042 RepID=UPI001B19F9D8|nr:hypothetical protein [Erythrobacter sp.]MBO6526924.1 hypothetical protein [Erythrobacter sp.]MBO6528596.1 hypothetical protein [Erythrobacter sp.]